MILLGDCLEKLKEIPSRIVALYVQEDGPYFKIPFVEPYGIEKDARTYSGTKPVICHPPCERWGSYWFGGPSAKQKRILGDDGGCFEAALSSVRRCGGILEHPAKSHAWKKFGIAKPPKDGGWIAAGDGIGFTCQVEQGHYGHVARKPTWLYAVNTYLPELKWGPSENKIKIDESFATNEARRVARANGVRPLKRASKKQLVHTPIEFREILILMALSVEYFEIAEKRIG